MKIKPAVAALALFCLFGGTDSLEATPAGQPTDDFMGPPSGFMGLGNPTIRQVLELPDQRVLAGGNFTSINQANIRYLALLTEEGFNDNSFQPDLGNVNSVNVFHHAADGRILVGGSSSHFNTLGLLWLNPDGSRDPSFTAPQGNGQINAILPQADGTFLVADTFTSYGGEPAPGLVRIDANGNRDHSFDVGLGPQNGQILTLTARPDGRILAGGHFRFFDGIQSERIVQLHPNGSVDSSFQPAVGFNGGVSGIYLQGSQIIVRGFFSTYRGTPVSRVVRLNANADLDTSFGEPDLTISSINGLSFDDTGRLMLVGRFSIASQGGQSFHGMVRLLANGRLDTGFETMETSAEISGMHRTAHGRIYLSGRIGTILGNNRKFSRC